MILLSAATPADLASVGSEPPQSEPDNPRTADLPFEEIDGPREETAKSVHVQEAEGRFDSDQVYTEQEKDSAPRTSDASTTQNLTPAGK